VELLDDDGSVVQLALHPVKTGPGVPVNVPEGLVDVNRPPLTAEGSGATEMTCSALLWKTMNEPGLQLPL
jgi:hypothetical protein